jgi:NAD(P)-dependent dehydrogenase (short-subunit alcohol dehydrogenase family)
MELRGKTALVTGAAHRVGRSIALALARRGCELAVHYHGAEAEAEATEREAVALGVRAVRARADLRRAEDVVRLFEAIDASLGPVHILVNSAAELEAQELLSLTEADWDRVLDLNLRGPFLCLQQAARRMLAGDGGAIVNISDAAAHWPWPRYPVHSVSKAGLEMLTRVAAVALAPKIRVNAVAPGPVEKPGRMPEARWSALGRALPLARTGTSQDVAEAVVFCLENDYMTGEVLLVDGGDHLR